MRFNINPLVPYVFGAMLVVFGMLRVIYLGAPRPPQATEDEGVVPEDAAPVRGPTQRRHVRWGAINVLLGLFLLIWTYMETHPR
jgi:hypothetical protein